MDEQGDEMEQLNRTQPLDLTRKIITEPKKVDDFMHEGDMMNDKKYLNLTVNDKIESELENVKKHLKLSNDEMAATLAISVLSDLIKEQENGDEIIVRHKKNGKFWGKKKQYRIEFQEGFPIIQ